MSNTQQVAEEKKQNGVQKKLFDDAPPPADPKAIAAAASGTNGNNGNGKTDIVPSAPTYPSNLPPGIPTRMEQILDMVGEGKTIWDALVTVFGLHEANYQYLILERTRLSKQEANLVADAIYLSEHGIGIEPFDFAIPELGEWVINKLHAFISVDYGKGNARDEFREIASAWLAAIKAKAAAQGVGITQEGFNVDKGMQKGQSEP